MEISEWKEYIEIERRRKDDFFKMPYQSPLSLEKAKEFKGLDYYSPDWSYRFELELKEHKEKEVLNIEDTKGNQREFLKWGEFLFKVGDVSCKLQVYKSFPEDNRFFLPFRDLTSGKETYGAGRYLDLEAGRHQIPNEKWIVDFNDAYNPWCAYSDNYACPFTPPENWLKVPIYAGEKDYKK
jgi:uncharacterized protein